VSDKDLDNIFLWPSTVLLSQTNLRVGPCFASISVALYIRVPLPLSLGSLPCFDVIRYTCLISFNLFNTWKISFLFTFVLSYPSCFPEIRMYLYPILQLFNGTWACTNANEFAFRHSPRCVTKKKNFRILGVDWNGMHKAKSKCGLQDKSPAGELWGLPENASSAYSWCYRWCDEAEKESPLYIFGPAEGCPILTRSLQDQQEAVKTLLSLASSAVTIMGWIHWYKNWKFRI